MNLANSRKEMKGDCLKPTLPLRLLTSHHLSQKHTAGGPPRIHTRPCADLAGHVLDTEGAAESWADSQVRGGRSSWGREPASEDASWLTPAPR